MTEDQRELLEAARESLAAKHLLKGGFSAFAASRAYYAMFYVAQAFLEGDGMAFSKHSGTIGAFGQYFAHVGRVPQELHGVLIAAEKLRLTSDYGDMHSITDEQAKAQIAHAEEFVAVAARLIGPLPLPRSETMS